MELRKTLRKLPDGKFEVISFRDLKKGDVFMLFESDGDFAHRDQHGFHLGRIHTAQTDAQPPAPPALDNESPPSGAWVIQVEEHDCELEECWTKDMKEATLHHGDSTWHDGDGWYYTIDELPDEGSCGSFPTKEQAIAHAVGCGYSVAMTNPMPDPLSHNDPKPEEEKTEEKPMTEPAPAVEEEKLTETLPTPPGNVFTE